MAQSSREIYWSAILADFRRSGLTHVEFCRLRRISSTPPAIGSIGSALGGEVIDGLYPKVVGDELRRAAYPS